MTFSLLIVDDERAIRSTVKEILTEEGYRVKTADSIQSAKDSINEQDYHVILLDLWLPDGNGLDFLEDVRKQLPNCKVIVITGHGKVEDAVKAIKMGAYDFIEKPFSLKKLVDTVQKAVSELTKKEEDTDFLENIVGVSKAIEEIKGLLLKFAKTDLNLLITGEAGTGKRLIAKTLHHLSYRRDSSLVYLNCSSFSDEALEEELFGNAVSRRQGAIELSYGGTLFLDDVDSMSLRLQAKISALLETKSFKRLGGTKVLESDFRLVSASKKDIQSLVKRNFFREDLFYKISAIHVHIPPLRERKEDIMPLVNHYTEKFCRIHNRNIKEYTQGAQELLLSYEWKGNVEELKNFVERLVILHDADVVDYDHVKRFLSTEGSSNIFSLDDLRRARQEFEKRFIETKLKEYDYDVKKVAQVIGIDLSNLYRKVKQYGISLK